MPYSMPASAIEKAHGFTEVDGIPVQVGQNHREGFFQLINSMDGGVAAHVYGPYEIWPAIPQNTLNRR